MITRAAKNRLIKYQEQINIARGLLAARVPQRDLLVIELVQSGESRFEIASVLGLSKPRIDQIVYNHNLRLTNAKKD